MKKILLLLASLTIPTLILIIVNYTIITPAIIGNKRCRYDIEKGELTKIDELFFEISSNTGYHPEPTTFNFIFTTATSIVIGYILYKISSH